MNARDRILTRIRRAQGRDGGTAAIGAEIRPGAVPAPRPTIASLDGPERIDRFIAQAEAADATVSCIESIADLPAALATELRDRNLPAAIRMGADPAFDGLDWGTVDTSQGPGRIEEPATLSRARYGMAETGTLVLASGPDNPVTLTFLGETHFVALDAGDVKAGFEDMWDAFRASGLDPRTINMVTGPSRSADIGQTLQLGAHGPVSLHIFLVG